MDARPTVAVVIITNRTDDMLVSALESVLSQDHPPSEVILFGNGGAVEVPPLLRDADVIVREGGSPRNLGVAGGRNAAARLAGSDLLLFLDDDAILRPGSIKAAVATMEEADDVGAVAFRVVDPQTDRTAVWFYCEDAETWSERTFDVPAIVGGGNLVRREIFEELEGFWEGYFREMEEIDFSWRLLNAGWRIRYQPCACIEHEERTKRLYRHAVPSNLQIMWRLLPPGLALRQTAVKVPLFAARAVCYGEFDDFLAGFKHAVASAPHTWRQRQRLSDETVDRLKEFYGHGRAGARLHWSRLLPRRAGNMKGRRERSLSGPRREKRLLAGAGGG